MIVRGAPFLLAVALAVTSCGGDSDEATTTTPTLGTETGTGTETDTTASGQPTGDSGAPSIDPASLAPATLADPATVDACELVDRDDLGAVTGTTVTSATSGPADRSECTFVLDETIKVVVRVDLFAGPGNSTLNEPRPFDVGNGGGITGDAPFYYALADLNGWAVTLEVLEVLSGDFSETQLAAMAGLYAVSLAPGPGAVGGGGGGGGDGSEPSGEAGTCTVEVSGALTDSFTSTQGIGDAYASVWLTAEEQEQADTMFPGGAPDFQIGCSGGEVGGAVLISLFDTDVPLGSTEVVVAANDAGYFSNDGIIGNAEPITIQLTRFDEDAMAGSFTFTGDGLGTGVATVTVTFDFVSGL